jgi:hypothetical protein
MTQIERLENRLAEFKAQGRMPAGFRIPRFLLSHLTEKVAGSVNEILDRHLAAEANHLKDRNEDSGKN